MKDYSIPIEKRKEKKRGAYKEKERQNRYKKTSFIKYRGNYIFCPLTIGSISIPPLSIKPSNVPIYVLKICK